MFKKLKSGLICPIDHRSDLLFEMLFMLKELVEFTLNPQKWTLGVKARSADVRCAWQCQGIHNRCNFASCVWYHGLDCLLSLQGCLEDTDLRSAIKASMKQNDKKPIGSY
jgi:hypothetical protein